MRQICDSAFAAGVSAVIASDVAVMEYCAEIGMPIHISVQANVANVEAVRHYAKYADVIVLARELSLEQIADICSCIRENDIRGPSGERIRIEIFAHGALCVAVSGHCYMSLATHNTSANRGECYQPCRRRYKVVDDETGDELVVDNEYVMSPRDLCTVQYLDQISDAGVEVLKIEGRGRAPDYVSTVTRVYKEALRSLAEGSYTEDSKKSWLADLKTVFNRGFWDGGFYCGERMERWAATQDSRATKKREQIAVVSNYFAKPGVAEFVLWQKQLLPGTELLFEGGTTGSVRVIAEEIRVNGEVAEKAVKDDVVTVAVAPKVRRKDKVFVLLPAEA
jgi:putative protease